MKEHFFEGPSLGSQVLSNEDKEQFEFQNELLLKDLTLAVEESDDAKKWLSTPLGLALQKFIVISKQTAALNIAQSRGDDAKRAELQKDFDVIVGVAQFFGELLVAGEAALQHLRVKQGI